MTRDSKRVLLAVVRVALVAGGALFAAVLGYAVSTLPLPGSEGYEFVHYLVYVLWGGATLAALGAVGLGIALPVLYAPDGSLLTRPTQRLLARAAGVVAALGFVLAIAMAFFGDLILALLTWLPALVLAFGLLGLAVGWRVLEVAVGRLRSSIAGPA